MHATKTSNFWIYFCLRDSPRVHSSQGSAKAELHGTKKLQILLSGARFARAFRTELVTLRTKQTVAGWSLPLVYLVFYEGQPWNEQGRSPQAVVTVYCNTLKRATLVFFVARPQSSLRWTAHITREPSHIKKRTQNKFPCYLYLGNRTRRLERSILYSSSALERSLRSFPCTVAQIKSNFWGNPFQEPRLLVEHCAIFAYFAQPTQCADVFSDVLVLLLFPLVKQTPPKDLSGLRQ